MHTVWATSAPRKHLEPAAGGNLVWVDPIWTYRALASTLIKARELRPAASIERNFLRNPPAVGSIGAIRKLA